MFRKGFILVFILSTLQFGCSPAFKIVKPDPNTGMFPTGKEVEEKHITVYNLFPEIEDIEFLYLRTKANVAPQVFHNFMKHSLAEIGFKNVVGEDEMAQIVIRSGMADQVGSISDLVSLHKLSKISERFLLAEAELTRSGSSCWFTFKFSITDPLSAIKLIEVTRLELSDWDFDKEVNYPILNFIKKWYKESVDTDKEKKDSTGIVDTI